MANTEPRLRLRAALSHRDKAKLSIQECAQALASGAINKARHDSLYEFYSGHLRAAEQEVATARAEQRRHLDTLQSKLSAALDSQFGISERATSGILSATKANARNRELAADIERYRAAITECASLISANSAAELGGFIDLPLDQYARPTLGEPAPVSRFQIAATYLLPVVMLFSAFLPWLKLGNDVRALLDIVPLLSSAGAAPDAPSDLLRFVWLPFVLIPLLAYPISLLRDHQNAGWGLILTGLGAVSAVLVPLGALSVNPGNPVSIVEFIVGLQFGAFAYLVSGAALALLGAFRLRLRSMPGEQTNRGVLLLAASGLLILLAGGVVLLFTPKPSAVVFEARPPDPATGQIVFSCNNRAPAPIELYVPWPEQGNRGMTGLQATYGVSVYVQLDNSSEFKLFPLSQDYWVRRGIPFPENRALRVDPQHTLDLALDTRRLQDTTPAVQRIRLVVARADGRTAYSFDSDPLPSRGAGASSSRAPDGLDADAPSSPGGAAPGSARGAAAGTIVRYLGLVGEKIALSVTPQGSDRSKNVSVSAGDTVDDGWTLKEVVSQSSSIVLIEERTGKTISISRGSSETLVRGRRP
ncbi:MAG: hypothetical protein HZB26_18785 [Candidatus Hydrogenedentes bacterium]|nr:hypothetical protein [Candidatus Hydrogenedentota bacterium]